MAGDWFGVVLHCGQVVQEEGEKQTPSRAKFVKEFYIH